VAKKPRKKKTVEQLPESLAAILAQIEHDRPLTVKALTLLNKASPAWADHMLSRTIILLASCIESGADLAFINAATTGGRPVTLAIGVGEHSAEMLAETIRNFQPESDSQDDHDQD
jgi:hypothetical protein